MQFVFGSGQLFAQPEGFDNRANSPVQVGALRGVSVDMGFNPKSLHGGGHWPLAIGRGTGKVPCKADFAQFTADGFNALFFGGPVPTTGCTRTAVDEAQVIAGNAAMATHAASFAMDLGVTAELPSGAIFTRVASAPGPREYTVDETTGAYAFAPGTDGNAVRLSYTYADTSNGRRIDLANRNIGHTPRFSAVLTETFNGKSMTLTLPHCVAGRLSLSSKRNDFMVPSFNFSSAADDSGLVGTLNIDDVAQPGTGAPSTSVINLSANVSVPPVRVGTDSSVGITVVGLDPSKTYWLFLPSGQTFVAWSAYASDGSAPGGNAWRNNFYVTGGSGGPEGPGGANTFAVGDPSPGALYATPEAARAAFGGATITGYDRFTFWMYDPNPPDDRGGLSIFISQGIAP